MDRQSIIMEGGNLEELQDMQKAQEVGDTLQKTYPGHMWMVLFQGNALVVKNLAISTHYGFVIKHHNAFSASDLARQAVLAGGELLERAGMKRGAWDGEFAKSLEGSDRKFFKPA